MWTYVGDCMGFDVDLVGWEHANVPSLFAHAARTATNVRQLEGCPQVRVLKLNAESCLRSLRRPVSFVVTWAALTWLCLLYTRNINVHKNENLNVWTRCMCSLDELSKGDVKCMTHLNVNTNVNWLNLWGRHAWSDEITASLTNKERWTDQTERGSVRCEGTTEVPKGIRRVSMVGYQYQRHIVDYITNTVVGLVLVCCAGDWPSSGNSMSLAMMARPYHVCSMSLTYICGNRICMRRWHERTMYVRVLHIHLVYDEMRWTPAVVVYKILYDGLSHNGEG